MVNCVSYLVGLNVGELVRVQVTYGTFARVFTVQQHSDIRVNVVVPVVMGVWECQLSIIEASAPEVTVQEQSRSFTIPLTNISERMNPDMLVDVSLRSDSRASEGYITKWTANIDLRQCRLDVQEQHVAHLENVSG